MNNSDQPRPAAGTLSRNDKRTPRRIHRARSDDAQLHSRSETSRRNTQPEWHELDESGLDNIPFERLRSALERHRSYEGLRRGDEAGLNARSSAPPPAIIPPRSTTYFPASRPNPFPGPAFLLSGRPMPLQSSDNPYLTTDAAQTQGTGVTNNIGHRLSSATLVSHRTHDVPGEVWIDPLEREGLPIQSPILSNVGGRGDTSGALRRRSTRRKRGDEDNDVNVREKQIEQLAEHQAAGVVRAHTRRGWGWLDPSIDRKKDTRPKSAHTTGEGRTDEKGKETRHVDPRPGYRRRTHSDTNADFTAQNFHGLGRVRKGVPASWLGSARNTSQAHRAHPHLHSPKLGNGVLGALLTLYGHDHEHGDHESSSGVSTSDGRSDSGSDEEILHNRPHRPWVPEEDDLRDPFVAEGQVGTSGRKREKSGLGGHAHGGSASSILAHIQGSSLPAASKTSALVAGAGALSVAAVPQQASLVPDLDRPGYHLVRYSLEDLPKAVQRTPNTLLRGLRPNRSRDSNIEVSGNDRRVSNGNKSPGESPDTLALTIVASPTFGSEGFPAERQVSTPTGRKRWTNRLRDLPIHLSPSSMSASLTGGAKEATFYTPRAEGGPITPMSAVSARGTPANDHLKMNDYFDPKHIEETARIKEKEKRRKEREKMRGKEIRRKRRKAEVFITRHVAEILQRQEFILKLARAMMMFGGPSHRLVAQMQSTGRVLDLELSCMYLPDVMLISFEDTSTGTSNVKFIRQGSALDLEKLGDAHALYWHVIHDTMSVSAASAGLDVLMRKKPLYNFLHLTIIGGMCSASICSVSFSGSFIDSLASAPLGALLVAIQLLGVRNELYANVFEITIATLLSFLSAALASTNHFCYSAVASSSVVLILPGFIVLSGSLDISSRSLVAGAVRLCFALMYSLFLGFGLAIGAELYERILERPIVGPTDYACLESHDPTGPWWQRTPTLWWAFLTVPLYSLFLSMRLMAPWWRKEMLLLIAIASIGWVTNHFVSIKFPNQSDISAAVGAFAVGFLSNIYGRFSDGNAFVVMITGILFQVPSGLGNGGLLNFVSDQTSGLSSSYLSGFHTALQLISVAIGLTVGLGISLVVVHPVLSRRRASGLFSL